MIKSLINILTRSPADALEDALGLAAISVVVVVGLSLPGLA